MTPHNSKTYGRRCAIGCATWPNEKEYQSCPICNEATRLYRGVTPLDKDEATKAVRRAEFEYFYQNEWDKDESDLTDEEMAAMGITALPRPEPKIPVNSENLATMPLQKDSERVGGLGVPPAD